MRKLSFVPKRQPWLPFCYVITAKRQPRLPFWNKIQFSQKGDDKQAGEREKKAMTKYTNRFFRQFGCVCVSASVTLSKYKKEKKRAATKQTNSFFSTIRMCVPVCATLKNIRERKKGDDKVCSAQNGKSPQI